MPPQALSWTLVGTLQPQAHEDPPWGPPDPRTPSFMKGSDFQLCRASLPLASVSSSRKWGEEKQLSMGQQRVQRQCTAPGT